jgi:hypothetical protein
MAIVFTFFAVMVVTAILFGSWLLMFVIKAIAGLIRGATNTGAFGSSSRACGNASCRTINPKHARYCRRCGSPMDQTLSQFQQPSAPTPQFNPSNNPARQVARA